MSKKSKNKAFKYDPQWAKAKQLCRLNMEDVRMAKELGISPRSLTKNIPSKSQPWKLPVKLWIRELYEKMLERREAKEACKKATAGSSPTSRQAALEEQTTAREERDEPEQDAAPLVSDLMDEPPSDSSEPISTTNGENTLDDVPF